MFLGKCPSEGGCSTAPRQRGVKIGWHGHASDLATRLHRCSPGRGQKALLSDAVTASDPLCSALSRVSVSNVRRGIPRTRRTSSDLGRVSGPRSPVSSGWRAGPVLFPRLNPEEAMSIVRLVARALVRALCAVAPVASHQLAPAYVRAALARGRR
jgi:hypothetical protein